MSRGDKEKFLELIDEIARDDNPSRKIDKIIKESILEQIPEGSAIAK